MIKCPLCAQYFDDTCDVYSVATNLRGHPDVDKEALYSSIPCHVYNISNTPMNRQFGISIHGVYRFHFPLVFEGSDVAVKEHYQIKWTDGDISRSLTVKHVDNLNSHIEVEAEEDSVS